MAGVDDLKHVTDVKLAELDQSLLSSLSTVLQDRDLETTALEDDEVVELERALGRIAKIASLRPVEGFIASSFDGGDLPGLALAEGLASRGSLRYKNEEPVRRSPDVE